MTRTDTSAATALLQGFAEILKTVIRASDICGRLGGDEFLLVITHVEADGIMKTVERFREKLAVANSFK